jgi:hypothetical protein
MSLVLQSSGGGSVTLQEAVTASNLTITVPAVTGTMLTTASAGTVLQVVNATYGTEVTTASSTYSDTGLTATITPSSATSKILVMFSQNGCGKINDTRVNIRLVRGGTTILTSEVLGGYTATSATSEIGSSSAEYLDSPATTSATTYKTQFSSGSNTATALVQWNGGVSTITLMEIAG